MKRIQAVALAVLLAACGTMPQNPEDFRKAVSGGAMMTKTDSYEVNRSTQAVGTAFKQRAQECLGVQVRTVSRTSTSYQNILTSYKPTVIANDRRAELHLQQKHLKGVVNVYEEPEDGHYLFVVDALPTGARASKLQIIGPSRGYDVVVRAIKAWADGSSTACPDMTKIG